MNPIKYVLMFFAYLWLRFDPILYITFRKDWTPRYEFLASIFGETDTEKFLAQRINLVKARNKILPPIILLTDVDKKITEFLTIKPSAKLNKTQRLAILDQLIFWAVDPEINRFNIDSYKSRSAIVDGLLNIIFQNSLISEINCILDGLKKIVFSRVTYLGSKGEPSPIVHNVILSGTARILISHFNEVVRLRDEKLEKMTKVKLIKEIQKSKGETGSLAFSAEPRIDDDFEARYPLPNYQAKLLWKILTHYRFSAWPESREKAAKLIANFQKQLGFPPEELFALNEK
ncbi:hypothetical protein KKE75_01900 [Patescibacteria group bacterium]|nr:hypothetical protein [Patescibacteria group bacterium]